ncbi:MAG TPA: hypothetical protein ENG12_01830, partial [Candidatus Altiarchaeales archaeon]|nr:hypothetical protein [Candidatus Altiarchaeales archaeon]
MSQDIRRMMNDNQLGIFEGRDEKQPSERLTMWRSKAPTHARPKVCRVATGICGFYEPTERIT